MLWVGAKEDARAVRWVDVARIGGRLAQGNGQRALRVADDIVGAAAGAPAGFNPILPRRTAVPNVDHQLGLPVGARQRVG